ncbi:hypothetical protein EAG_06589, partial [Camponotus floridanus]
KKGIIIGLKRVFKFFHPWYHGKNFSFIINILLNNGYSFSFILNTVSDRLKSFISCNNSN